MGDYRLLESAEANTDGDTAAASEYTRTNTFGRSNTLENIGSTLTRRLSQTLGISEDQEAEFTKNLIDTYTKANEDGVDGDVPLPGGFGQEYRFWRISFLSIIVGVFMGAIGILFQNAVDETPKQWVQNGDFDDPADFGYYAGHKFWIIVPTVAGLFIGILRYMCSYPENLDGIFKEINTCHVDYRHAPLTLFISMISLACGATLGPEQALGTAAGGLGVLIGEYVDFDAADKKLMFLSSMAGGIGSLFPSPMLTVIMFYELGKPPKEMVESMIIIGFSALAAFIVGYPIIGATFLDYINTNVVAVAVDWKFELWHCIAAFVIGIISALLSLAIMIIVGITKQIFARIRMRLIRFPFARQVLPPIIGGAIVGTINWVLPMTFGNGNMILHKVIEMTYKDELGWQLICASAFARAFILGVSMNSGFIGGFIFPMITIAVLLAMVCFKHNVYDLPFGLCISCFIAGVPGGICPMPFTLALLAILLFNFGAYQSVAIFISALTSYTIVSGSGLILALQARATRMEKENETKEKLEKERAAGMIAPSNNSPGLSMPKRESSLDLNKYLDK